jgi:hypothetical protein
MGTMRPRRQFNPDSIAYAAIIAAVIMLILILISL